MKITTLTTLVATLLSSSVFAADNYTIDTTHTFPSFEISHLGFSMQRGRFNNTTGKIVLDVPKKQGSIDIVIDAASIDTGLEKLEEHLRGEDFFNVAEFPKITFKSSKLEFNEDKLVGATGDLTLHGVTKPVTLAIDHFHCGTHPITQKETCGANAVTTIKRTEFGISKYAPAVGDEVKIIVQVEAFKD